MVGEQESDGPPVGAHLAVAGAAVLFGTTFVTVQRAIEEVEPLPFLAARFLLATAVLAPFAAKREREPGLWRAGSACGAALLAGYVLQTVGLQYTTATTSAFITYLLVVLVPVFGAVAGRRLPRPAVAAGVAVSVAGLALLTGGPGASLGRGELLTLGCAAAFAVHILLLGGLAPRFDPVALNTVQLGVVGAACLPPAFVTGGFSFSPSAWLAVAYTAVAATALAFGLQVWGQRRVGSTRTALLLMIEPVAAAALGWFTGDQLVATTVAGAALILAGVALAEAPVLARSRRPSLDQTVKIQ